MGYPATWEELQKLRENVVKRDSFINFVGGAEVMYHPEHHGFSNNTFLKNKDIVFIVMKKRSSVNKMIRIYHSETGSIRWVHYKKLIIIKHKQ